METDFAGKNSGSLPLHTAFFHTSDHIEPEILKDIIDRDERDMSRAVSPLKQAEDAVLVDSSEMGIEEVVESILSVYRKKVNG